MNIISSIVPSMQFDFQFTCQFTDLKYMKVKLGNNHLDTIVDLLIDGRGKQLISLGLLNLTHSYFDSFLIS